MSTTWVFLGLLAGRQLAISMHMYEPPLNDSARLVVNDKIVAPLLMAMATNSATADTPKQSDLLLRQFDTGNYSQATVTIPSYFQADWYNWLFHHWRPITQPDKTQFYLDIANARAQGVKVQARVEFDANWKTFAEYFTINNIDHRSQSVPTLEGSYQLYPAHLGMPGGQNCTGQNCASSRFTEDQLNQGLYTGQTWTYTWNGQQHTLPPFYYSTHSPQVQDLLKQQVNVLMTVII